MKSTDNLTDGELFCCPACREDLFQKFCLLLHTENGVAYWSHFEGAPDGECPKDHRAYLERVEPRGHCECPQNNNGIKYLKFRFVGGN